MQQKQREQCAAARPGDLAARAGRAGRLHRPE
jgi:hypothetical protein